uniref:Uncharacterized protein n=1 Tax=Salvator merianae TaxID=96440 RepID=A0A8D0E4J6_SALMN
ISRTLAKPSTRPVGLPCANCVWNTSRMGPCRRAGSSLPPLPRARGASPSTSVLVSLDLPFFLPLSPRGILPPPQRSFYPHLIHLQRDKTHQLDTSKRGGHSTAWGSNAVTSGS